MVFIWKVTERCNLSCSHCYVGSSIKRSTSWDFPLDKIDAFFKFLESFRKILEPKTTIIFHGGEPFIRDENFFYKAYEQFLALRKKMSYVLFESSVQTNLLLYRRSLDFFIKKLFQNRVGISWDGTVSPYRRHQFYDIYNYYKTLKEKVEELKNNIPDVKVGVLILLNKYNSESRESIRKTIKEILALYPSSIRLNVIHDSKILDRKFQFNKDNIFEAMKIMYSEIKSKDPSINIYPIDDMISSMNSGYSVNCPFLFNCPVGFLLVRSNGSIGNCDEYDVDNIITGSIYSSDPIDIMTQKTRLALSRYKNIIRNECKDCEFLYYCQGGCMTRSILYFKSSIKKDPLCFLWRNIFNWLKKEGDKDVGKDM